MMDEKGWITIVLVNKLGVDRLQTELSLEEKTNHSSWM